MISFSFFPATIISPLPLFRTINFANPSDKARHDCHTQKKPGRQ